jgi:hypothetical protein
MVLESSFLLELVFLFE